MRRACRWDGELEIELRDGCEIGVAEIAFGLHTLGRCRCIDYNLDAAAFKHGFYSVNRVTIG